MGLDACVDSIFAGGDGSERAFHLPERAVQFERVAEMLGEAERLPAGFNDLQGFPDVSRAYACSRSASQVLGSLAGRGEDRTVGTGTAPPGEVQLFRGPGQDVELQRESIRGEREATRS